MKKLIDHRYFTPLLLLSVILISFSPGIFSHRKADPDAQVILAVLNGVKSPADYLEKFKKLELIDVQPLRDATLLVDNFLFNHFSINSFVFQNCLWWFLCCLVVLEILKNKFSALDHKKLLLIMLAFSVYPLFSTTVVWGMARKHLLSFFFIGLATERFLSDENKLSLKNKLIIIFSYLCAMLSQPIGILWPLWATAFVFFIRKNLKRDFLHLLPILGLIFLMTAWMNNFYYHSSQVYLQNFAAKPRNFFQPADQMLALGHYFSNLLIPYFPSFQYTLGHWSTLTGLVLLAIILWALYKAKNNKEDALWMLFFLFPLVPVLTQPEMMQDTYLLIPSLGALILILLHVINVREKILYLFIGLGVVFCFQESRIWLSTKDVITQSFMNAPNCLTASSTVRLHHAQFIKAPSKALDYVENYGCLGTNIQTVTGLQQTYYLQSTIMFFDDRIPLEKRLEILRELSRKDLMGLTYLSALYIKLSRTEEARASLAITVEKYRNQIYDVYDVVNERVILPYCLETKNEDCISVFRRHSVPPVTPFN